MVRASDETVVGKALPIAKARLKIERRQDKTISVEPDRPGGGVQLRLAPGRTRLRNVVLRPQGEELCSAYYVYVRRK